MNFAILLQTVTERWYLMSVFCEFSTTTFRIKRERVCKWNGKIHSNSIIFYSLSTLPQSCCLNILCPKEESSIFWLPPPPVL